MTEKEMSTTEDSLYPRNVGKPPSDDVYRHVTLEQKVDGGVSLDSIDRDLKLIIKLLKEKK